LGADNHRCLATLHSIAHSSPADGFHRNKIFRKSGRESFGITHRF
jgi:hypothetical protein